jgi:hypothetical protein
MKSFKEHIQESVDQGLTEATGNVKLRYTGGMHGEYEPHKKQASQQAHLDAAKYHDDEANTYVAAMNNPKSDQKNKEWYKSTIQYHKNKADFHRQAAGQGKDKSVSEGRSVGTIPASVTAQLKKDAKRRERNVFHQIGTKLRDNVAKINAAALKKEEFELEEEHKVGDLVSYFHDRLGDHLYGKVASVEPDHITMKTGGQTWKVPKHLVLKADKNKVPKYRYEEVE